MKKFFLSIFLGISLCSNAQIIEGTEIGFDGFFSASTQGGALGIGPKFGFLMNENLIIGPSFRFQRTWSNNLYTGVNYSYNNYGGGFFLHGRYKNTLFGGFEFEVMKNKNVFVDTSAVFTNVVPTLFVCAGFSREFKGIVRLNVGLYYDVINSKNSPFRKGYILPIKNAQSGAIQGYVPLIYRISFFFPLTKTDKSKKEEEVIEEEEETW